MNRRSVEMQQVWSKTNGFWYFIIAVMVFMHMVIASAEESTQKPDTSTQKLEDLVVTEPHIGPTVSVEPEKSTIRLEDYKTTGVPQNVGDVVKDLVIIDYRGASDLIPDDDTLYMRGFSSKRFVTALDGATLRKTGGRRSSHIVDYALLPPFLIESIEVLPGPHSAIYPGKSIGGVVNFITRDPVRYDTLKPDLTVSTSYGTYATQNHSGSLQGSVNNFTYDLGYQKYATDGYLRHGEVDIDTFFSRFGYILPNNGYVTLSASYADADRNRPTVNDPFDSESDWDPDYPLLEKAGRIYYQWQNPTWDKESPNFRLNFKLPTAIGTWTASGYYGEENRDNSLMVWVDNSDHSQGTKDGSWDTKWHQQGGKVANTFKLADAHETTVGADLEQCYDGYGDVPGWGDSTVAHDDEKRIEILSGFAQHKWSITQHLNLTAGLRYEDTSIWVSNFSSSSGNIYITGRDKWIERNWSAWSPKSFLTYELDDLAEGLRDTSVSLGVSRIWRAPDYHGDYNPQGRPAGAWLDPEDGVGCDLVFNRRLFSDVQMKLNYAYYQIKDYIATNSSYAKYTPSKTNDVEPGMEYMDYKINLEEVIRHGVELQFSGHLTNDLSFLLGYAWQDFENQGDEPAGETELDDRAANRVTGKLTYQLFETTSVTLDYEYQDEQVIQSAEEIAPDVYTFEEIPLAEFHVVDLSIQHKLFENWRGVKNGTFKLFINNLLNEDYENTSGYPATGLTVGTGVSFQL
jgi:iron complex outermembrane receptor protein